MEEKIGEIIRTNTSIKIDPEVWKQARIEAIKYDMTASELLEVAIKEWIEKKMREK